MGQPQEIEVIFGSRRSSASSSLTQRFNWKRPLYNHAMIQIICTVSRNCSNCLEPTDYNLTLPKLATPSESTKHASFHVRPHCPITSTLVQRFVHEPSDAIGPKEAKHTNTSGFRAVLCHGSQPLPC